MSDTSRDDMVKRLDKLIEIMSKQNRNTSNSAGRGSYSYDIDDFITDTEEKNERLRKQISESRSLIKSYFSDMNETSRRIGDLANKTKESAKSFEEAQKEYQEALKKSKLTDKQVKDYADKKKREEQLTRKKNSGTANSEELKELRAVQKELKDVKSKYEDIDRLNEARLIVLGKENKYLKKNKEQIDESRAAIKQGFNEIKQGFNQVHAVAKDFMSVWGKIDQSASKFAKSIGISVNGMNQLRKSSINAVAQGRLGAKYNLSAEELIELQGNYSRQIGRNVRMSGVDQENMAALNALMGENGMKLATSLENFGLSYTEAAAKAGKMFKTASEYGVSFEKYAENVQEGLSIAQNYTFANGIKGMQEMAKKATAIKLDMKQISSFADKVNSVQGAIETGAKLQVLGGPFAQMGDPLGMLSDSINNVEGLLDRFTKMTGGLGRFDAEKGEVTVSAFNKRRLQVAAEAMGMSYDEVMKSVQAQGRQNYVGSIIGNRYSKEDTDFLKNIATIENGQARVSYTDENGQTKSVNLSERDLTAKELKAIKKENQSESEDVKDIARQLRGWEDVREGFKKQFENTKAQWMEKSGIGKLVKSTVTSIGTSNLLLGGILGVLTAWKVGGGLLGMGKGVSNTITGARGMRGALPTTAKSSSKAVSASKNASIFGKTVGKGTKNVVNVARDGKYLLAETAEGTLVSGGKAMGAMTKTALKSGGAIASGVISGLITGFEEFGGDNNHSTAKKAGKTAGSSLGGWGGAAAGAAIGSAIAPGVGTVIGGIIGGLGGSELGKWIGGGLASDKRRDKFKNLLELDELKGDYSVRELKAIKSGNISEKLRDKIKKRGDGEVLEKIENAKMYAGTVYLSPEKVKRAKGRNNEMAEGGLLYGPSHGRGGMPILGSNIEVEGGEYVVNKRSAAKNIDILNAINKMGNGGRIMPRRMETGGALEVAPKTASSVANIGPQSINININGSIKLEGKNGQSADITNELLKDSGFIRNITKMIEEQMGINKTGGRVVNKGLY